MNSRELAARLSPPDRERYAASFLWGTPGSLPWPEALRDAASLEAAWRRMPRPAAVALRAIVLRFGSLPFSEEQLLSSVEPGEAGADYRIGLLRLSRTGIVFTLRKSWGEKLHFLPRDSYFPWYRAIVAGSVAVPPGMREIRDVRYEEQDGPFVPPFGNQLLHLLAELVLSGGEKTAKGLLGKRTMEKCSARLHISASDLAGPEAGRKAEAESPYPLPLAFALDAAMRHGWLRNDPAALRIDEAVWSDWLRKPSAERESGLLGYVMERIALRCPNLSLASAAASDLEPLQWYRLADLERRAQALRATEGAPVPPGPETAQWLGLMRACGWLEAADTAGGERCVRWLMTPFPRREGEQPAVSSQPKAGEPIHILPDGDMLVPEGASGITRWNLELFGTRERTDLMSVYRLDGRSLERAAKAGRSLPGLARLLEADSGCPLPSLVEEAIFARSEQPGDDGASGETEGVLTADACAAEHPTARKSGVAGDGLKNRPFPGVSATSAASESGTSGLSGLWSDDPFETQSLELLPDSRDSAALFDGLDDIPAMWLRQFRTYHLSTRKELLERALEWRVPVKLSCNGAIRTVVPAGLPSEDGQWMLTGYEYRSADAALIRLRPEMWQEMMLLVPAATGENE